MSAIIKNLDWSVITDILLSVIPALLCITFHEFSHGFVALKLGDNTAKASGRLSLNPIKHIDFVGLIMMAVVGFGWAKPVPVNMNNFKNPKHGMAVSALAGPVSSLLFSAIMFFLYGLFYIPCLNGRVGEYIIDMIARTAILSASLAVFNFIPIPPLDGSKVVFSLLSDEAYYKLMRYERYGMLILVLLLVSNVLDKPLNNAVYAVIDKMNFIISAGFKIGSHIF